jgi:hypothetical protein
VQCSAVSKRSGRQCKGQAIEGATVCRLHGGSAPQVRRAAERRLATQSALQWATERLEHDGVPDRTPLEHLEAVLEQDARAFALWDAACSVLVEEGSTLLGKNRHGEEQIHPYVLERNEAAKRWARTAKYALDAGVAERRVQIEQDKANLMATALRATLARLGLDATKTQQGLVYLGEELRQLAPPSA